MTGPDETRDLHEALIEAEKELQAKPGEKTPASQAPEHVPPPPSDWVAHPVTRGIGLLILVAAVVFIAVKGPQWLTYLKEHRFGATLIVLALAAGIILIAFSYWRARSLGPRGDAYWYIEDSKRKRK